MARHISNTAESPRQRATYNEWRIVRRARLVRMAVGQRPGEWASRRRFHQAQRFSRGQGQREAVVAGVAKPSVEVGESSLVAQCQARGSGLLRCFFGLEQGSGDSHGESVDGGDALDEHAPRDRGRVVWVMNPLRGPVGDDCDPNPRSRPGGPRDLRQPLRPQGTGRAQVATPTAPWTSPRSSVSCRRRDGRSTPRTWPISPRT